MDRKNPEKIWPDLTHELHLSRAGFHHVAGLDEAGRGAWAGPVVAASVILPIDRFDLAKVLDGVRDSKVMTAALRSYWARGIREVATAVGLGVSSSQEVDQFGLIPATRTAMKRAIDDLGVSPDHLLIDHLPLPEITLPQTVLTRGDSRILSVAAASVIAKVARDKLMIDLDREYPEYGFSRHKGYGTPEHRASLLSNGPCHIHRFSFSPVVANRLIHD